MNFGGTIRVNRVGLCIIFALVFIFILYLSPIRYNLRSHTVNLRKLLLVSIEAAEKGGYEIVKISKEHNLHEQSKGETREGANIPVTDADYKSHCVMYYGITKIFPSLHVISEEKEKEKECKNLIPLTIEPEGHLGVHNLPDEVVDPSDITVWIDPLDATQEFTEHLYEYVTTMVCVAYKGNPIIGVIHKPFAEEPRTTWAWIDKGKSPHLIFKDQDKQMKKPAVIVSRSHLGTVDYLVKQIFGQDSEIIHAGGSGYKSLEVASGNVTAYVHSSEISKWDICAGDAIVTALGGRFTSLSDKYIHYSYHTNPVNRDGLLASMYDHGTYIGKAVTKKEPV